MDNSGTLEVGNRISLLQTIKDSMPEDWGMLLSAFASSYGIGLLALLGLPFMIGATIDGLGLSESQAGFLGTLEFLAIMAASIVVAPFMSTAPRRILAFIGVFVAVVGNLLCLYQAQISYDLLMLFRIIAGLGCGLALAVGNATVSNAKNPEKLAAQMSVLFVTLMAITMLVFAWASNAWGYKGMYAILAFCMICVSPLLLMLPPRALEQPATRDHPHAHKSLFSLTSFFMLSAMFVFALRDMSGWAFVERIGLDVGYSGGEIGLLLSAQALLGISGPMIASVIGSRFGLKIPLTIGIVTSGLVYFVMLLLPTSIAAYTASAMFIGCTYFYTLSYLTALAAELDSQGRIVAASGGFLSAGVAFGPLVGGRLIEAFGYGLTSWAILGMAALTLVFAGCSLRSLNSAK
ncbi:MAG: MFS transporter [Pseudomonadales bacterium]|nr:MFS transporter [Pseudomonadales bacterium]